MKDPCRICGEAEHVLVSRKDRNGGMLDTVVCMGCGIITNDPIPSYEEIAAFYRTDYRAQYKGTRKPRRRQVWRNFKRLENHFGNDWEMYAGRRNCLDIGSGSGEFMYLSKALGMECVGVEPDEEYSVYSRETLGLRVLSQTLEETEFPAASFDVIRLSHVIEHMRDPVSSLKVMGEWLSDNGVIYIEVPDIEREAEQKLRGRLFHFGHIFNFNPFTLRLAAGLAGLEDDPATKSRFANKTAGFFCKSTAPFRLREDACDNAQRMKVAMDTHYARIMPRPREGTVPGRFFRTIADRIREFIASVRFPDHLAIAKHFGKRVSSVRAKQPDERLT